VFALMDALRQTQGQALERLGFGPTETRQQIVAAGRHWRLRDYGGAGASPPLLIVSAPIKRPYIWDLAPAASAIRYCRRQDLHVLLLEWLPPSGTDHNVGLAAYADQAIGAAVATVSRSRATRPFLIGHSLGGTLAAIFAALHGQALSGLVLLGAPLCFPPGVSRFRDAIVAMAPSCLGDMPIVPGSLLSQLSALASPETFVWSRLADALLSSADPLAWDRHARVERWALDEVPLPGRLVHELLECLYRENRLCEGTLRIGDRAIGPFCLRLPLLAVINTQDEIAPLASIQPLIEGMPAQDVRVLEYPGETGVALQHLGILVGPQARARVWPEIMAWLRARY
jgi:polyhydroxyalkanoate synthase